MTFEQVVKKFQTNPKYMQSGAGKLAKRFKTTRDVIYQARNLARSYEGNKKFKDKLPKILVFDIESSPSISYTFGRFNTNIGWNNIKQEPIMLTWAAKWLGSADHLSDKITKDEVIKADDYRIVKSLWDLMDTADIVIAHYGDRFDLPLLNTRAIINRLPPYNTIRSIDTKKVASGIFKFPSNKLDALAKYFGFPGKIETDFQLWIDCLNGDENAIQDMETYNIQDVFVLENVYLTLRPYIKSHPNVAVYMNVNTQVCSSCGSTKLTESGQFQYTNTGKFPLYRCECGALSRGRRTDFDKGRKKNLLTSIAR